MKLSILFVIINISFLNAFTQNLKLKLNTMAPRVGDELSIDVLLEGDSVLSLNKNSTPYQCSRVVGLNNNSISGEFKFNQYPQKPGLITVGPITLSIDNRLYKSDSIQIWIDEKLPDIANGLWFRIVELNKTNYLIIEERIVPNKKKLLIVDTLIYGDSKSEGRPIMRITGSEFTALNYTENKATGLDFSYQNYRSELQNIGDNENKIEVNYQKTVYKIEKDKSFTTRFILNKDYFKNLPSDYSLPLLIIKPE